jgi:hypothetical protein
MSRSLHPDAQAILTHLKQERITALYHFTNVENLPNTCQLGALCSKRILEKRGLLSTLVTGGNPLSHSLDRYQSNWDKVAVSFTPYTPMAYNRKRAQHLCFFLINPEVAAWSNVVFTDSNATRNDQKRGQGLIGLNNVQFNAIHAIPFSVSDWHRFVQAEILIPDSIPLAYVTEIGFVSNASMDYAKHLCDSLLCPPFSVIPQLFTDSPKAPSRAIGFSYVHELMLGDTKESKNMVYSMHTKENKFSNKITDNIAIMASVRVITGMRAKISLCDTVTAKERVIMDEELPRSNEYKHECTISLGVLPAGIYLVKYYLGEVCWASSSFEVVP